jgi:hypothetical protein
MVKYFLFLIRQIKVTLKTVKMLSYQIVFVFTLLTLPVIYSRPKYQGSKNIASMINYGKIFLANNSSNQSDPKNL